MPVKNTLIHSIAIALVVILPHTGLFPNFLYSIPIILFVWLYLRYFGEQFSDIGFSFKNFSFKAVCIGTIAAILILAFLQLVFFPVLEIFITFDDTVVDLYDFIRKSKWNYVFILIMGWIIGGLYEEIVFHGFIFTRLEKMTSGRFAVPISFLGTSLLFGAYHLQLGPASVINAFLVGTAYHALALYFKRNLWTSIICHGVYDSIVITLIYLGYF